MQKSVKSTRRSTSSEFHASKAGFYVTSRYGIEADDVKTENCSMYYGVEETIRYYNSKDGNCYTVLSSTTYAGHEPIWTVTKNARHFITFSVFGVSISLKCSFVQA